VGVRYKSTNVELEVVLRATDGARRREFVERFPAVLPTEPQMSMTAG